MNPAPALFPRNFRKQYPEVVRAEGCYFYTADGRRILDAVGGAAVVSIGHGVASVAEAMAEQARRLAFIHTSEYHTAEGKRLAARLRALAPPNFQEQGRVIYTCGGSEAAETAIKLARKYWIDRGQPQRARVLSRQQSYHGNTLGALSVSGNIRRRKLYAPMLHDWGQIAPCYCYRCPLGLTFPECRLACADELDKLLATTDLATVAAFIFEPVSGATLGAAAPPAGYVERLAEICRARGILLIADEVMTGMGRTGKPFAVEHWGIAPDMILVGKGIAGGYAPLGAVLVAPHIAEAVAQGSGSFEHGFTYQAHPVSMAASHAVLDYMEQHNLFARVEPAARELLNALAPLTRRRIVGDLRGKGLLLGLELVHNAATREPFPAAQNVADRFFEAAFAEGVATYPIRGCVDGERGDHVLLAPPFTIASREMDELAMALDRTLARLERELP
jgi:adenosylmethionine-8-amino-7-oxononanoate aminotransferase